MLFEKTWLRRLITIPGVYLAWTVVTVLFPALLVVAIGTDVARRLTTGSPFVIVRMLGFAWMYLLGEAWGLVALAVAALTPHKTSLRLTYRVQDAWVGWNMRALLWIFGIHLRAEGEDAILPGPIIVIARHASMIDTLLPSWYVSAPNDLRLRYVLKNELLLDPALDVAGRRLPNHFIDRGAGDSERDIAGIRALASDLAANEAVLIYPEGTRFSEERLKRHTRRFSGHSGEIARIVGSLKSVLPPRPSGTNALLEGCEADVVVMTHRGLEGLARLEDMWAGDLIGSRVEVAFRRIPRTAIPATRSERAIWLFQVWEAIDRWVSGDSPGLEEIHP